MRYRTFGATSFQPSALGFGCMRLPTHGPGGEVDEPAAIAMIRHAIDQGVNYLDTAYVYHGGQSEAVLGRALAGGYREKVAVATKMPVFQVREPADFDRIFAEQLRRLQTGRIDAYLLHNLQAPSWARMLELGALPWLERTRAAGSIGLVGFSFHDDYPVLEDILDGYDGWDFCQLQYNYLCEGVQAGTRGVEHAAARGLGVVIMEPLFGGTLAQPPPPLRAIWDAAGLDPVDGALQWLWDKPQVSLVLSGMSTLEQVQRNLQSAATSRVGGLSPAVERTIALVQEKSRELHPIPCTRCGYCLPCPQGVAITENFQLYGDSLLLGGTARTLNHYLYLARSQAERAESCVACRACEEKCPQGIAISEWLPKVHEALK